MLHEKHPNAEAPTPGGGNLRSHEREQTGSFSQTDKFALTQRHFHKTKGHLPRLAERQQANVTVYLKATVDRRENQI